MQEESAIFKAIRTGEVDALRQAIGDRGQEQIKQRNEKGTSPLTLTSYQGNLPQTRLLIEAGADPDAMDVTGTALMGASFKGFPEVVSYLLEAGASIGLRHPATGATALHFATMFGQTQTATVLLDKGADPRQRDHQGKTAMDYARDNGMQTILQRLAD